LVDFYGNPDRMDALSSRQTFDGDLQLAMPYSFSKFTCKSQEKENFVTSRSVRTTLSRAAPLNCRDPFVIDFSAGRFPTMRNGLPN
jgi:hypothetical protein